MSFPQIVLAADAWVGLFNSVAYMKTMRKVVKVIAASVCVAALATTMTGCSEGGALGEGHSGAVNSPARVGSSPAEAPTQSQADPRGSHEAGADVDGLDPDADSFRGGDAGESPGPLDGTIYVISTQNVVGAAEVAELIPVPLEDTEEAAFHTAFMLMNTADDVYARGPDEPGDLSYFAAISAPECAWCESIIDTARTAAASNLRVTGGGYTAVGDSFDGARIEDGSVVVNIPVIQEAATVWNPNGTVADGLDAAPTTLNVQLEWQTDMWKVMGVSTT